MPTAKSDLSLIQEFRTGEQQSFEELLGRYADKVYNLGYRLTRRPDEAEEVLQDVFVTVFRKIGGFEGKSSFSSWLYRVTVNAALMKLRKRTQNRMVSVEDLDPEGRSRLSASSGDHEIADELAYRRQLLTALEYAVGKLPDDYRPVFVLRDVDGLTSWEVGKILNLSVPAVKSRLHRSRLMLRRRLSRLYREYRENGMGLPRAAGA
jgi:RNA polymerase sigma-70 factor, ECF subfamily